MCRVARQGSARWSGVSQGHAGQELARAASELPSVGFKGLPSVEAAQTEAVYGPVGVPSPSTASLFYWFVLVV